MIATMIDHGGGVLEIELTEHMSAEDYRALLPQLREAAERYGRLRLLVDTRRFEGWTMGGVWEELKIDFSSFNDVQRLATVGKHLWNEGMGAFSHPFPAAEFKHFGVHETEKAMEWLRG